MADGDALCGVRVARVDMGNLHQAIWNTAHGNWFHQTISPATTNRLSLHVEPILLPIACGLSPLPGRRAAACPAGRGRGAGAVALYALGEKRRNESAWGRLSGVAWLLMPAMQAANWLEFHPVTLAPTFLLAAFYFLLDAPRSRCGLRIFAVLCGNLQGGHGAAGRHGGPLCGYWLQRRRFGILTMVLGVGWSLVAVLGIHSSLAGTFTGGATHGWATRPAHGADAVHAPWPGAAQLRQADAGGYLFQSLLPVGFLALLAPEVLLLALPSLAINLLADFPPMHQVDDVDLRRADRPFVALAAVLGRARFWLAAPHRAGAGASGDRPVGDDGRCLVVGGAWLPRRSMAICPAAATSAAYGYGSQSARRQSWIRFRPTIASLRRIDSIPM